MRFFTRVSHMLNISSTCGVLNMCLTHVDIFLCIKGHTMGVLITRYTSCLMRGLPNIQGPVLCDNTCNSQGIILLFKLTYSLQSLSHNVRL